MVVVTNLTSERVTAIGMPATRPGPPVCAIVSFRLGGTDGVSIVARSWAAALTSIGYRIITVAGSGPVDRVLPGLAIGAQTPPDRADVATALADADLVVVENLCTIPLNLGAALRVAGVLRGRPAILHHHDPAWQRPQFAHIDVLPPQDSAWRHVTINRLTEREFARRGLAATTIYNGFDVDLPEGHRHATRAALGIGDGTLLLAHPVRAIARKDVPAAVRLAEGLGATYWLLGPAEDGYEGELRDVLAAARTPVLHRPSPGSMADAYAAADAVVFPSTWEGFGNPPLEAALHRRPAAVGPYPVAAELRALGFSWFPTDDPAPLLAFLASPDPDLLDRNEDLVRARFSQARVEADLRALIGAAGWGP